MAEHYFTETPGSPHRPIRFQAEYRGKFLVFQTDSGVFSRTEIDRGSRTLLNALPDGITGDVLDMGCGYGALGVCLKKHNPDCRLMMADINERAVQLARSNAEQNGTDAEVIQSNGFAALVGRRYDLIVTNPPIRAGKPLIYAMFKDAANALKKHGSLMLVIRKQQGAPSAITYLKTLFQTVDVLCKKGGYWVIFCTKDDK